MRWEGTSKVEVCTNKEGFGIFSSNSEFFKCCQVAESAKKGSKNGSHFNSWLENRVEKVKEGI